MNTKKSLKASGLSLVLCIAMLIGTTFAWFTDSITNTGNKIESGDLKVTLQEWNGTSYVDASSTPIFNYDKWEPGYTDVAAIKIGNAGSLALKYKVDFVSKDKSQEANKLAKAIDVYYLKDGVAPEKMPTNFADLQKKGFVKLGTLPEFLNREDGAATGKIEAQGADFAMIALHMQESAGSEYQNLSVGNGFDIIVNAIQLNKETDGFGNPDYDADAKNPVVVSTTTELKNAVAKGGVVKLEDNIQLSQPLAINDKKVEIRLGDKKLSSSGSGNIVNATGTADVTISGGELNTNNSGAAPIFAQDSANVKVEKCNIVAGSKAAYGVVTNGSLSTNTKIVMTDCKIDSPKNYAYYFPAGDITLKNCNVKGAVIISGGDVKIDGGTYTADGFTGQPKIWHKADTISYMQKFSSRDGCGHMGDSILIMDRRSNGYDLKNVSIKNVNFDTQLTLKDGTKATAYAVKYIDYNNKSGASRVNLNLASNKYNNKLADGKDPLMFIGIDGSDINN